MYPKNIFKVLYEFCNDMLLLVFVIFKTAQKFNFEVVQTNVQKEKRREICDKIVTGGKNVHEEVIIPKSVNYHFTRRCNYECGFCFHTAKTSYLLNLEDAKIGLKMLKDAGMEKINFSGGEPFLPSRGKHLGEMVKFCKLDLKLPSISIVSNGSLIKEKWFERYGRYVDIMAISCDSFNEDTNKAIGRGQGTKNHIEQLFRVRGWCQKYDVLFKLNTVVNTYNYDEDMCRQLTDLNPIRWKVFQCLLLEGENAGPDALRNAERFYISEETFNEFLERHKEVASLVPESNTKMQNSYLILDEYMRFLDCRNGSKVPSKSILDVGVENALLFSGFDERMFKKRGGVYKWSKEANKLSWKSLSARPCNPKKQLVDGVFAYNVVLIFDDSVDLGHYLPLEKDITYNHAYNFKLNHTS